MPKYSQAIIRRTRSVSQDAAVRPPWTVNICNAKCPRTRSRLQDTANEPPLDWKYLHNILGNAQKILKILKNSNVMVSRHYQGNFSKLHLIELETLQNVLSKSSRTVHRCACECDSSG